MSDISVATNLGKDAALLNTEAQESSQCTHPLAKLLPPYSDDEPDELTPKNRYGIGTSTYIKAVKRGHQLCQRTHPCKAGSQHLRHKINTRRA
jgi:hypothetical protein